MKACDKKLRDSLLRVMNAEENAIREEMKQEEPYVFSESFEQKMKELMQVQKSKSKRRYVIRYAVAAVAVVLLIGGILFIGSDELRASDFGVKIQMWMENFFVVENDTSRGKDETEDVLFDESRIGYLPEGFEKVEEVSIYSEVYIKYQDAEENYIVFEVLRDKTLSGIDNDDIAQEVGLNTVGMEYRYIYKSDSGEHILTWIDKDNISYSLISSLEKDEIIEVMNNIFY